MFYPIFASKLKSSGYYLLIIVVTALNVLLFNGCSKNDYSSNPVSGTPAKNEIFIQGMAFASASKTITVGTTIKWTNQDAVSHTVTSGTPGSPSGAFDSGNISPQGTYTFTFKQKGVFNYFCSIHTNMTAVITVQ